jgi:hypothetical protein
MPDGLAIRILITLLGGVQVGIATLLALDYIELADVMKAGLVVASAVIAVVLNQVPSWQSAPAAERRLRKRPPID